METPKKSRRRRGAEDERVLRESPCSDSKEHLVAPDFAVEDWLLMGGKGGTNNNTASSTPKSSPRGRGRSPRRSTDSPAICVTPEQQRTARSLEPKRSLTCKIHWSPQKRSSDTSGFSGVGTPIPGDYIKIIVTAFGAHADLYKDVLGMEHEDSAPAKLRVAYFRRGRQVLQMQQQALTSPVSIADAGEESVSAKQKFRAITKAYEILANPGWNAYYEAYGLVVEDESIAFADFPENQELKGDIASITNEGGISILRRSNSWGPTRSRSASRGRVCWKEVVEELVYQPDRVNTRFKPVSSSEYKKAFQALHGDEETIEVSIEDYKQRSVRQVPRVKRRLVIDSPELNEDFEKLDKSFKRGFLANFEASLDGLEAKLGDFVSCASSATEDNTSAPASDNTKRNQRQNEEEKERVSEDENGVEPSATNESSDSSLLARQLFTDLSKPYPLIDPSAYAKHRTLAEIERSALASHDNNNVVTTAPLKMEQADQPKTKHKRRANRKKKVDKVPTLNFDPFSTNALNSERDAATCPSQDAQNGCMGCTVSETVKAMTDLWNAGENAATKSKAAESGSTMSAATTRVSSQRSLSSASASNITGNESLRDYRLRDDSSILSSDTFSELEMKLKGSGFDVASAKALSFDDDLTMATDATTKGSVRMDRYADKQYVASPTSDDTFASKGNRLQGIMMSLATQAKETIREVATVQETETVFTSPPATTTTQPTTGCDAQDRAASGGSSNDANFLAALNGYMQMLVDDMSKLGSRISTNLGEANRAVAETMTFPVDDVDGMLLVLESNLNFPDNSPNDSFLKAFEF